MAPEGPPRALRGGACVSDPSSLAMRQRSSGVTLSAIRACLLGLDRLLALGRRDGVARGPRPDRRQAQDAEPVRHPSAEAEVLEVQPDRRRRDRVLRAHPPDQLALVDRSLGTGGDELQDRLEAVLPTLHLVDREDVPGLEGIAGLPGGLEEAKKGRPAASSVGNALPPASCCLASSIPLDVLKSCGPAEDPGATGAASPSSMARSSSAG